MASAALKLLARHPATRSVLRTTCVTQCRLCSHVHISSSDSGWQLREGERITKVGAVVNVALAGAKAVAGWATGSSALLADAGHSLSDLVSDAVTLWAVRLSRKPPDHNHTYGHGKFESVGAFAVSGMLVATGVGLGWHAVLTFAPLLPTAIHNLALADLLQSGAPAPVMTGTLAWAAVATAVASVAAKEVLYRATIRVGRRIGSNTLVANAWHHRTDALSSIVALGGIGGALAGVPVLDPLAGALVSLMIVKEGVKIGWSSMRDLTDEIDTSTMERVHASLRDVCGVQRYGRVRARRVGSSITVDVAVHVDDSMMSVSTAHQVVERVRSTLLAQVPDVSEVQVHLEPTLEDSDGPVATPGPSHASVPLLRPHSEIETDVRSALLSCKGVHGVSHVVLHFSQGQVCAQVSIEVDDVITVREANRIARRARLAVLQVADVAEADIHLELEDRH